MEQAITWEFAIIVFGLISGVAAAWYRIEARVDLAKREATTAASAASSQALIAIQQIADLRVHIAETYASKGGVREMSDRLAASQERVLDEIGRLNERLDRMAETRDRGRSSP